jgi:hypothetical protein
MTVKEPKQFALSSVFQGGLEAIGRQKNDSFFSRDFCSSDSRIAIIMVKFKGVVACCSLEV